MLSSSWRTSKEEDCPYIHLGFLSREATMQKGIGKNREVGCEVWTKQTLLQHISCCLGGRCWRNSCPPHLAIALPPTAGKNRIRLCLPLKWPNSHGSPKRLRFLISKSNATRLALFWPALVLLLPPIPIGHQSNYGFSRGSINGEEGVLNCCTCYVGCQGGRVSAAWEKSGLTAGWPQLTQEGLSHWWGTAAPWAGGSHAPLPYLSKFTVSTMSNTS